MTNSLVKLARQVKSIEQFVDSIIRFPKFYLRTPEEKMLTKKDLREFYLSVKGNVKN